MTPYTAVAAVDVLLAGAGRHRERFLTKPLLMPLLARGRNREVRRALLLGGAGDVALLGRGPVAFSAGLGAFLAGHVAWVVALRPQSDRVLARRPAVAAPYVLAWSGLNAYLWRRTGRDRLPVLLYSSALLATALAALDTGEPDVAAGGALFLLSDSLLALERFGGVHLPAHEGLVMAGYTGGQALLARVSR